MMWILSGRSAEVAADPATSPHCLGSVQHRVIIRQCRQDVDNLTCSGLRHPQAYAEAGKVKMKALESKSVVRTLLSACLVLALSMACYGQAKDAAPDAAAKEASKAAAFAALYARWNAAAIAEFGISRGEPIDKGFVFDGATYIEAPYVVERRGLAIYINDMEASSAPEWPPYDFSVDTDPGPPPPGVSRLDPRPPGVDRRDRYWSRKYRYLFSHFEPSVARQKMIETYRASFGVEDVREHERSASTVVVVFKDGRRLPVGMRGRPLHPAPSKEEVLAAREIQRRFYERILGGQAVLFRQGGFEGILGGEKGRKALHILISPESPEEKLKQLQAEELLFSSNPSRQEMIVRQFKATPQLKERLDAWDAAVAEEERKRATAGTVAHVLDDGFIESIREDVLRDGDDAQRHRIRDRISTLRSETFDDLMETIYEESWYRDPGVVTIQKLPQLDVEIILSNRRFARLREMLENMPSPEADAVCRTNISQGRKRSDDAVARALRAFNDPDVPKNTVSMLGNKWGICMGILLAAEFCDTRTVLDAIDAADEAERKWLRAIEQDPDSYPTALRPAIKTFCALQTAFKLNAISRAAYRDATVSGDVKNRLTELMAAMDSKTVQLVAWDAEVTPYDFPHIRQGVPVDVTKGVEDVQVYRMPIPRLTDLPWQQQLLGRVRQLIDTEIRRHER